MRLVIKIRYEDDIDMAIEILKTIKEAIKDHGEIVGVEMRKCIRE